MAILLYSWEAHTWHRLANKVSELKSGSSSSSHALFSSKEVHIQTHLLYNYKGDMQVLIKVHC